MGKGENAAKKFYPFKDQSLLLKQLIACLQELLIWMSAHRSSHISFLSSPEQVVLRVSYCDGSLSSICLSVCLSIHEQLIKESSLKLAIKFQ